MQVRVWFDGVTWRWVLHEDFVVLHEGHAATEIKAYRQARKRADRIRVQH